MTASPPTREFDLILLGATGVTGSNAAEYLARVHGLNSGLKWAIAGRSLSKLEAVKERCLAANPSMETVKIVTISDTMNADLIEDFVKKTAVVLSTVGKKRGEVERMGDG